MRRLILFYSIMFILFSCSNFTFFEWDNPIDPKRNDIIPPNEVSEISWNSGDGFIDLYWKNPDDIDLDCIEIWYGINDSNIIYADDITTENTQITDLQNDTEYTIKIITVDTIGNKSSGVTTKGETLNTRPPDEISNLQIFPGDQHMILSWVNPSNYDFDSIEIWYGISSPNILFTGTIDNTNTVLTNLTNNETYHIRLITVDKYGLKSLGTLIIEPSLDTISPLEVTSITATGGNESISLSWTESSDINTVEIWYGLGSSDTQYSGDITSEGTILPNLINDAIYTITIIAVDSSGNRSDGEEFTVSTYNLLDPGDVTDFSYIVGDSQVLLSWSNPNDNDFIGVEIWYGIGDSATQYFGENSPEGTLIKGLENDTEYTVKIISVDSGNKKSSGITNTIYITNSDLNSVQFFQESGITLENNSILTVEVLNEYDSYSWELYGLSLSDESNKIIFIDCSLLSIGLHTLYAITTRDGISFSGEYNFWIVN